MRTAFEKFCRVTLACALIATTLAVAAVVPDVRAAGAQVSPSGLDQTCQATPALTSGVTQSGVIAGTVGEQVALSQQVTFTEGTVFQDVFVRPDGSDFFTSYLEITAGSAGIQVDPDTFEFQIDGVAQATVAGTEPDATDWVLDSDGTTFRVFFPADLSDQDQANPGAVESLVVPAGGITLSLTIDGLIADIPENTWGSVNEAISCFAQTSTGDANRSTDRPSRQLSIVEPLLALEKSAQSDTGVFPPGSIVTYAIDATVPTTNDDGTLATGPAHDTTVVDTLPINLDPVDADGAILADGATTANGGVWNATDRTLTFNLGTINPGDTTTCLLYTSPSPRDRTRSRMPSSA